MNFKFLQFFNYFKPNRRISQIEKRVYESLIGQAIYKNTTPLWAGIIYGLLTYSALLSFKHDALLHVWIIIYLLYYIGGLLLHYLYTKGEHLSFKVKKTKSSPFQIIIRGFLAGFAWVFLFYIVRENYPIQSQLISAFALLLYASGVTVHYASTPLWGLTFISVAFFPICIWLALQGGIFLWICLGITLYAIFVIMITYSYYGLHFKALSLQFQKEKLIGYLRSSKKKVKEANIELLRSIDDHKKDIQQHRKIEQRLATLALRDSLTRLPNRLLLQDRISRAIIDCKREGHHCAILFIDLDHFKFINDALGHPMGDKFLRAVAKRLKESLREQDTISRVGGDEFVILIPKLQNEKYLYPLVQMVKDKLSKPYIIESHTLSCSPSIGVSVYPRSGESAEELISHADMAMYKAKDSGGNLFTFYTNKMNYSIQRRIYIEKNLKSAISKNKLFILYHPIINLKTGHIESAEALVRMRGQQDEILMPSEFIPIAEEIGLIYPIGLWVIEKVCNDIKRWTDTDKINGIKVNINASTKQIKSGEFVEDFKRIILNRGISPSLLELEITETLAIKYNHHVSKLLKSLIDLGVTISIDDFGTGHSNFNYLNKLPIHKLKIHRSFIRDSDQSQESRKIIKTILFLAQEMNLEVVAEGIETSSQLEYIKKLGCHLGQGDFLSKPITEEALLPLFSSAHKYWENTNG